MRCVCMLIANSAHQFVSKSLSKLSSKNQTIHLYSYFPNLTRFMLLISVILKVVNLIVYLYVNCITHTHFLDTVQ